MIHHLYNWWNNNEAFTLAIASIAWVTLAIHVSTVV